MRARLLQFESRVTNHESRPFQPSLVRGDTPRNAPLCYTAVRARLQPVAKATVNDAIECAPRQPIPPLWAAHTVLKPLVCFKRLWYDPWRIQSGNCLIREQRSPQTRRGGPDETQDRNSSRTIARTGRAALAVGLGPDCSP